MQKGTKINFELIIYPKDKRLYGEVVLHIEGDLLPYCKLLKPRTHGHEKN